MKVNTDGVTDPDLLGGALTNRGLAAAPGHALSSQTPRRGLAAEI